MHTAPAHVLATDAALRLEDVNLEANLDGFAACRTRGPPSGAPSLYALTQELRERRTAYPRPYYGNLSAGCDTVCGTAWHYDHDQQGQP